MTPRRRLAAAFVVVAAVAVGVGACSGGDDHSHGEIDEGDPASTTVSTAPPFTKAEATTAVDVVLQDYAFVGLPEAVAGPNVHLTASIKGANTHEIVLLGADGAVVEDLRPFKRPARQSLAVVLAAGTYRAECLIKEGSRTHAQLGMRKTFTVT